MEDEIFDIVTDLIRADISKEQAIDKLLSLHSVSKNEAICNCENEYWKEDEGGDWYCTIHDKLSTVQNVSI